jgi:ssDNA-binding Zn-finger/Zn-ribbon topoisomerase 1
MPKAKKLNEKPKKSEEGVVEEKPQESGGLITLSSQVVAPVVTPQQAKEAWNMFQATKKSLLEGSDYQSIITKSFRGGSWITEKKPFVKKSGWRKLATAFNLSDTVIKELRVHYDAMPYRSGKDAIVMRPGFVWEMTVRAIAPNGRYAEGVGSCASNERGFAHIEHDVRATAMTRAKNRAISDLIGGGEVSAEEMEGQEKSVETKQAECPVDHSALPIRTVLKEGKNKGRLFKTCPTCKMFEWQDEKEEADKIESVLNEAQRLANSPKQEKA